MQQQPHLDHDGGCALPCFRKFTLPKRKFTLPKRKQSTHNSPPSLPQGSYSTNAAPRASVREFSSLSSVGKNATRVAVSGDAGVYSFAASCLHMFYLSCMPVRDSC